MIGEKIPVKVIIKEKKTWKASKIGKNLKDQIQKKNNTSEIWKPKTTTL